MRLNKLDWNLEDLLKNKSIDKVYAEWKAMMNDIVKIYPSFFKTKNNFIKWLDLNLTVGKLSNRLLNYISNNINVDLSNQTWIGWSQKLTLDSVHYGTIFSNYENIVLKHQKEIIEYLKDKKISKYIRAFDLIFKLKPHVLSNEVEKALAKTSAADGAVDDIFTTLLDNDLKFPSALDSKNKRHEIKTTSDVFRMLTLEDRVLRKNVWINFNKAIYDFRNTLAKMLYYNYLKVNSDCKLRNFNDYVSATAFNDEINVDLILKIYDKVKKFKPQIESFKILKDKLLKQQLKVLKLEPWDKMMELSSKPIKYTVEQAQHEILKGLKPLGREYIQTVKKIFDDNWISWMPKQGKISGAYSIGGTYGVDKKYILLNFDSTTDSVSTLAHELGHSMHSFEFDKTQDIYAGCSVFYAEISSIINETLLRFYWLDKFKNDKKAINRIYCSIFDDFFATTTRQIIFSNFEYEANKLINEGKTFTYEVASDLYLHMIERYEGVTTEQKAQFKKEPYKYSLATILRISHFYANNFYVYKYAIGQIVALVVAEKLFNNDKEMLKKYFSFLQSGKSKSPIDTIKILGFDLYQDDIYNQAEKILNKLLKQFKDLN